MRLSNTHLRTMKAIHVHKYGGIEELKVTKSAAFPQLTETKVSIDVHSSGVNPVDTYIRSGNHFLKPKRFPYIPGKDGAGVVLATGNKVTKFKVGDRVYVCDLLAESGTLAERITIEENLVHPLSDKLTFHEGASLGIPYWTAFRALFHRGYAKPGHKILIHGASGSVGMAALQIAKAEGLDYIVGTAGTFEGQNRIKDLGAKASYNHKDKDYIDKIKSEHGKFDVIIEMLANVNLQKDLEMINAKGTVVVVGSRGDVTISPRLLMGPEASVVGCSLMSSTEEETRETFGTLEKGIENGFIKPVIGKVYNMEMVQEAHDHVINNSGSQGKIVVDLKV